MSELVSSDEIEECRSEWTSRYQIQGEAYLSGGSIAAVLRPLFGIKKRDRLTENAFYRYVCVPIFVTVKIEVAMQIEV